MLTGLWIAVGLLWAATLMGCGTHWSWLCDLASHFRLQYAWVLGVCAALFVVLLQPLGAGVAVAGVLANLWFIVPLHVRPHAQQGGRTFRAMSINLWLINHAYDRVRQCLRTLNPDFVVFQEVSEQWLAALQELSAEYPFSKEVSLHGGFGLLLLSRLPVERVDVIPTGTAGLPSIIAHLRLDDQRLTVIGTHPHSPISPRRAKFRNRHLAHLAEVVSAQSGPVMVLGDLNTTSWTTAFQECLQRAHLHDSRVGFGLQPTWPSYLPWLRIPIDHCLVSSEIIVSQRRVGPHIGSDHFPIAIDFSIE